MNTISLLYKYIEYIFPMVDNELENWRNTAKSYGGPLCEQAVYSINNKGFHARGGCAFALYPGCDIKSMVRLITAYQTISDYLDNLCDRMGVFDVEAFKCLHLSMTDALNPDVLLHDYYNLYPFKDDGGYLNHLVETCRKEILRLPSYHFAKDEAFKYASLYCDMQSFKHLQPDIREKLLFDWAISKNAGYKSMKPWEFCAASGSTLSIFALFSYSSNANINKHLIDEICSLYFPWICELHILLDYFIDYNEDIETNELNFIGYYKNDDEILQKFKYLIDLSLKKACTSDYPVLHRTIVLGLLSLYFSDHKAYDDNLKYITQNIISSYGIELKIMHKMCLYLRKKHII